MSDPRGISNDDLKVEQRGHIVVVTMDRPDRKNAFSALMLEGMAAAWRWIDEDPEVRVAVLTGAGGDFCAGADLKDMASARGEGRDGFADRIAAARTAFDGMLRSYRLAKPLIAAVEGYAVAGGTEILQACDIRVAGESAKFGLTEVQRALFPIGGSTVRLQRQIPFTRAMEILLTGEPITAREALEIGLIGRVVPDGQALDEALRIADRIARNGPVAVQAIKRSVRETAHLPEEQALEVELRIGLEVFASEDAKEGARAFAEKREPRYQGR